MKAIREVKINLIVVDDEGNEEEADLSSESIDIAVDKLYAYNRHIEAENEKKNLLNE